MGVEQLATARDRLLRLVDGGRDLADVLNEVLAALHDVARFSWVALMTVDPATILPTSGVVEGLDPAMCAPFWDHELLVPGFNKFTVLARSKDPVATLYEATDGDLRRAPIYNELYVSLGVADELRAAFVVGTRCWGILNAVRAADDGPYTETEIAQVRNLAPTIARVLRTAVCALDADASAPAAMVVVDGGNRIAHLTVGAAALLDDLRTTGAFEEGLPTIVGTVVRRARASHASKQTATRVCGTSGRWLRVTASPLEGEDGSVAVMLEPARPGDMVPIILEGYGLTEREIEIVLLLARGFGTKEIAAELSLSSHTIRDHIKLIFEKVGVNSRGELVARLFSQHLLDGFHSAVHRV